MLNPQALQLRVGVDVGSRCHSVAVGLSDGSLLEEFEIPHTAAGFGDFFARIEGHAKRHPYPIAVAMEGYNGHVRPLDSLVRARGWRLFNVNNLKLAGVWLCGSVVRLAGLTQVELPPPSPASSDGSTGMVPIVSNSAAIVALQVDETEG